MYYSLKMHLSNNLLQHSYKYKISDSRAVRTSTITLNNLLCNMFKMRRMKSRLHIFSMSAF